MQKTILFILNFYIFAEVFSKGVTNDRYPYDRTIEICRRELGITKAMAPHIKNDGRLMLCVVQKVGVMDITGKVNPVKLKSVVKEIGFNELQALEIVERCTKQISDKAEENALELFYCVHKGYL